MTEAFAGHDIELVEKIRRDDAPGEISLIVLGADSPCETGDLSVNIFGDRESLELMLRRGFGCVRARYESREDLVLVKGNLFAVMRRDATCFRVQTVEEALQDLH